MINGKFIDLYGFFQIPPDADINQIKAALRTKRIENHPDKNAYKDEISRKKAEEDLKIALEGYDILSNETYRTEYDKLWKQYKQRRTNQETTNQSNNEKNYESFSEFDNIKEDAERFNREYFDEFNFKEKKQNYKENKQNQRTQEHDYNYDKFFNNFFSGFNFNYKPRSYEDIMKEVYSDYDFTEVKELEQNMLKLEKECENAMKKLQENKKLIKELEEAKEKKLQLFRKKIKENDTYIKAKKYVENIQRKEQNPITRALIKKDEWEQLKKQIKIIDLFNDKINEFENKLNEEILNLKNFEDEFRKILYARNEAYEKYTRHPLKSSYENYTTIVENGNKKK